MKNEKKQNTIIERVVVPGDEANNQAITHLLEQETTLQIRNFKYRNKSLSGYIIELNNLKTIAGSFLKDPDKYRTMKIFMHKSDGYHLLSPKDFREIIRTKKHVLDPRLKKSLREVKSILANQKNFP